METKTQVISFSAMFANVIRDSFRLYRYLQRNPDIIVIAGIWIYVLAVKG